VAAIADAYTGVIVYDSCSGGSCAGGGGYYIVGGTSLATPVTAALYANMLARKSFGESGVRVHEPVPVHSATKQLRILLLLRAHRNNGFAAGPGYDLVTGLGGLEGTSDGQPVLRTDLPSAAFGASPE